MAAGQDINAQSAGSTLLHSLPDLGPAPASGSIPVTDCQSASVQGVAAITPSDSTTFTAARAGIAIICTVPGNVKFGFADSSTITVPVSVGYNQFSFGATKLFLTGTTATATYLVLK